LRSQSLKERNAELARQIDEKRREIADLLDRQRRFKTDRDFVETIARRNKRVYPGELVFVFED
jgi:cell division protein FtsB